MHPLSSCSVSTYSRCWGLGKANIQRIPDWLSEEINFSFILGWKKLIFFSSFCPLPWFIFGLWKATGPASTPSCQPPSPLMLAATRWGARLMGPAPRSAWSPSGRQNQRRGLLRSNEVGRPVFKLRIRTSDGVSGHSLKATHQCHLELST